jgi:hypothetical protein
MAIHLFFSPSAIHSLDNMLRFVVSPRCRDGFADLQALVAEIGRRQEVDFRLLREGDNADWACGLQRDSTLVLCHDLEQELVLCGIDGVYNDFIRQAVVRTRGRGMELIFSLGKSIQLVSHGSLGI